MEVEHYRKMMECKTFGNSIWKRVMLFAIWGVFTILFFLDVLNKIELSQVVHVCSLLVMIALPSALVTVEINIMKYKEAYKEGIKGERIIEVDEDGFTFINSSFHASERKSWDELKNIEEMRDIFLINTEDRKSIILPKKSMGDNKKMSYFKELVIEKIGNKFYPLKG